MYAPTVLICHSDQQTAEELARVLQEFGAHALPLTNGVEAIEAVENLVFDVALVAPELALRGLPELLFGASRQNWLEVLVMDFPPDGLEIADFVLWVSEANTRNAEMNAMIEGAWHDGWYGEAGYEPGSSGAAKLTDAESEAQLEELLRLVRELESR